MSDSLLSEHQLNLMRESYAKLKNAFPNTNVGVNFNLSVKYQTMSYNLKSSGIISPLIPKALKRTAPK